MTITEFKKLEFKEKTVKTINDGRCIAVREEMEFLVNLYEVGDFMVEIWYSKSNNQVVRLQPVNDPDVVNLYIDDFVKRKERG